MICAPLHSLDMVGVVSFLVCFLLSAPFLLGMGQTVRRFCMGWVRITTGEDGAGGAENRKVNKLVSSVQRQSHNGRQLDRHAMPRHESARTGPRCLFVHGVMVPSGHWRGRAAWEKEHLDKSIMT